MPDVATSLQHIAAYFTDASGERLTILAGVAEIKRLRAEINRLEREVRSWKATAQQ